MKAKKLSLIFLLSFASVLRFWELGTIPEGLSVAEVNYGLSVSKTLGTWVLNPTVVRLPFAFLGVVSVFLFYKLSEKYTKNELLAFISTALLTILPWHISQSRVATLGLVLFTLALILLLRFFDKLAVNGTKLAVFSIAVALFFIASLFSIPPEVKNTVDKQRNLIAKTSISIPVRIFSNKIIESYRYRQRLLFENMDIGNYLFMGHPRERWGVEEIQKLYIVILLLGLLGLARVKKERKGLLISIVTVGFSIPVITQIREPSITLILAIPIVFVATAGAHYLLKQSNKAIAITVLALLMFEFLYFTKGYFSGNLENLFSPRRPVYGQLVKSVDSIRKTDEKVLVSTKLVNPEKFFKFFSRDSLGDTYDFKEYDYRTVKDKSYLFIDALNLEPSPNEPLYTKDNSWPADIETLAEFQDHRLRKRIVVFRIR